MNNGIGDGLPDLFEEVGLIAIEKINSDEHYVRNRPDFKSKVSIWSKAASSEQMVKEGYLDNDLRI